MRIFITNTVPRDQAFKYNLSAAACNFSHNLIEGEVFDKTYSILPAFVDDDVKPFEGLEYSRVRKNKLLRKFAPVIENISLFFKIPHGASVWYYNCTVLNANLICLLKVFKPSVKQHVIMLDYTPSFKKTDRLLLRLANSLHGMIKLADSPLFYNDNSILMPGVVPGGHIDAPSMAEVTPEFLLAGELSEQISMLSMIVEVFRQLPKCTLHITGRTDREDWLRGICQRCPNIIYHGMTSYKRYIDILHSVSFVLSTRDPRSPENQCNFPSKILESLKHNRIIISTIHYPQIDGINYFETIAEKDTFIQSIKGILNKPQSELLSYANQGFKVSARFNPDNWANAMTDIESYHII